MYGLLLPITPGEGVGRFWAVGVFGGGVGVRLGASVGPWARRRRGKQMPSLHSPCRRYGVRLRGGKGRGGHSENRGGSRKVTKGTGRKSTLRPPAQPTQQNPRHWVLVLRYSPTSPPSLPFTSWERPSMRRGATHNLRGGLDVKGLTTSSYGLPPWSHSGTLTRNQQRLTNGPEERRFD